MLFSMKVEIFPELLYTLRRRRHSRTENEGGHIDGKSMAAHEKAAPPTGSGEKE